MNPVSIDTFLTPNKVKEHVFASDSFYLSSLEEIRSCFPSTRGLCEFLWNTSALLLRPDAVAGGQAAQVLPFLRQVGFIPVAAVCVGMTLDQTRELWRYQANVSTPERLHLLDLLMTSGMSIFLLLRDTTKREHAPATVHLTYLKGTAIVANRRKCHLRTLAGPRIANVLSYVHVSDDPADLIREMALILSRNARLELVRQARQSHDRTDHVRNLIVRLEAQIPRRLLDGQVLSSVTVLHDHSQLDLTRVLNTDCLHLTELEIRSRWQHIVEEGRTCKVFVNGDSYDGRKATVPDDKEFSLPLDGHLVHQELGPR